MSAFERDINTLVRRIKLNTLAFELLINSTKMDNILENRNLRAFVTVARTLNLQQASRELNLTPSALSHSIRALEENLNVTLFDRSMRKLKLTAVGHTFLGEVNELLNHAQNIHDRISSMDEWRNRRIRIGSPSAGCQYIISGIIREFKESFPDIAISIEYAEAQDLVDSVIDGRLDLAITPLTRDFKKINTHFLASDSLTFVVHPQHELAKSNKVKRTDLADLKYILPDMKSQAYELIDAYFRSQRIPLRSFIEVDNEEVIKNLIRLDIGVGVLPEWVASREIEKGILVPLDLGRKALSRNWYGIHREGKELSFPETVFLGVCRLVSRNLIHESVASVNN